jgi:Leucine-rich repeat (LRR) protein
MQKVSFLLILALANTVRAVEIDDQNCWHNVSHNCEILALLTRSETNQFHVNFNCSSVNPIDLTDSPVSQRYLDIPKIFWEGCLATNYLPHMGLTLIVDPSAVIDLEVVEFKIENLESKIFENFTSLRSLQLQRNSVKKIENDTFASLVDLKTLVVKDNQVETIDVNALYGGWNLTNLTIDERFLEDLKLNFTENKALESAILAGCKSIDQQTIVSLFKSCVHLRTVTIRNTKLTETFLTVPTMLQLEIMDVSNCQLMSLHLDQPTLLHLNISHNDLKSEIYLQLHNMAGLVHLDLSYNLFNALRNMFCNDCINLEVLNLNHNQITFVANDFLQTNQRLQSLDLSNNRLHVLLLDMAMLRFESLQAIYVDRNPWICSWVVNVSRQHGEVFAKFKFVRVLDKININGLQCQVKIERPPEDPIKIGKKPSAPAVEGSASPREPTTDEINFLTICLILMLTVIVAVALFICLYDRFKRMRHMPFYRLILPADRISTTSSTAHIILRKLPATDYEAPISLRDDYVKDGGQRNSNLYEELPSSGRQTRQCSPSKQEDSPDGVKGQSLTLKDEEECLV